MKLMQKIKSYFVATCVTFFKNLLIPIVHLTFEKVFTRLVYIFRLSATPDDSSSTFRERVRKRKGLEDCFFEHFENFKRKL